MTISLQIQPKILYRIAVQEPGGLQTAKGRRPRDHFFVTEPDPATKHYRVTTAGTAALTKYLSTLDYADPEKPSAVPIRVMGNPVMIAGEWTLPSHVLRCELAYKLARGTICHCSDLRVKSDEEAKADNLTPPLDGSRMAYLIGEAEEMLYDEDAEGRPVLRGKTTKVCNPARCPRFQGKTQGKCKPDMTFIFQAPWLSRYGPWMAFKSTSYRSYQGIRSTLTTISLATNGWLFDLPLWLCTRIERTGDFHNPVCWIEYRVDANGEFEPEADELHAMLQGAAMGIQERWMSGDERMKELTAAQEEIEMAGPEDAEAAADMHEFHPDVVPVEAPPTPADRKRSLEEEARVIYQAMHKHVSDAEWKAKTQGLDSLEAWEGRVTELRAEAEAAALDEPEEPQEERQAQQQEQEGQQPAVEPAPEPAPEPAVTRLFDYEPGDGLDNLPTPGDFALTVLRELGEDTLTDICQEIISADRPGGVEPADMQALVEAANHAYAGRESPEEDA